MRAQAFPQSCLIKPSESSVPRMCFPEDALRPVCQPGFAEACRPQRALPTPGLHAQAVSACLGGGRGGPQEHCPVCISTSLLCPTAGAPPRPPPSAVSACSRAIGWSERTRVRGALAGPAACSSAVRPRLYRSRFFGSVCMKLCKVLRLLLIFHHLKSHATKWFVENFRI